MCNRQTRRRKLLVSITYYRSPIANCSLREYRQFLYAAGLLKWTGPSFQVIFKLFSKLFHERHGRHGGCVPERAKRSTQHVLREVVNVVDVFLQTCARVETCQRLLQPVGTFAAGNTPSATLVLIELDGAQRELHHAVRVVEHDRSA